MKKSERVTKIIEIFEQVYGDADCTLDYKTPLQLLVATQLAAQCTDARVNIVCKSLFKKYKNVEDFAIADLAELQEDIRSTGFFRNKSKNLISCCRRLIDEYDGEVPDNMKDLLTLAGVGRKTANLILSEVFGIPSVVVDTHATRISRLLGLTKNTDPYKIELDLQKVIPRKNWSSFCHQLVYHGRASCHARSPKCAECPINFLCPSMTIDK